MSSDEITSVLIDPYALAPASVKYPDKRVCDVLAEQVAMMTAASHLLDFHVSYNVATRPEFVSVYVPDFAKDPAELLSLFEAFQVAYWKWSKYNEALKSASPRAAHPGPLNPRD